MMVRFRASGIAAVILSILILLGLGIFVALAIPLLAIMVAVSGITFMAYYLAARVRTRKRQQLGRGQTGIAGEKGKEPINVKGYRIR